MSARAPGLRLIAFDESEQTSYKTIVVELTRDWTLSRNATLDIPHAEGALARPYDAPPLHRKSMSYPHVPAHPPLTDPLAETFMSLPCGHRVCGADIDELWARFAFMQRRAGSIQERRNV